MLMSTHAEKNQQSAKNLGTLCSDRVDKSTLSSVMDQRPQAAIQGQLQLMANNSSRVQQFKAIQALADQAIQRKMAVQLQGGLEEEDLLQGKFETAQLMDGREEEDLLQGKFEPVQLKGNNTGLPDDLKSGVENLSGFSMDDVQVHYNSLQPKQLQAHAYAQGTNIHLEPGQERHLPHEAWYVVQQKQGRVQATMQAKGVGINDDDPGLEKEADVIGAKAWEK